MSSFGIGTFALPFVQSFFPAGYLTYACLFDIGNSLLELEIKKILIILLV